MRADSVDTCSGFDNNLKMYLTALYLGGSNLHWKGETPKGIVLGFCVECSTTHS
jgi:hypothetical protein